MDGPMGVSAVFRNLSIVTDLMIIGLGGEVEIHPSHAVGRWPELPDFYWGNVLFFAEPPREGDFDRWEALWDEAFGDDPRVCHRAYGFDSADGSYGVDAPFLAAGFKPVDCTTQVARAVTIPARANRAVVVRPLGTDAEWARAVALHQQDPPAQLDQAVFDAFVVRKMAVMRRLVEAGRGRWLGAFLDGVLVASCGVFVGSEGVGRYQDVVTDGAHRRQGISSRLVAETGRMALETMGAQMLVITADTGSSASRIYEAVGLKWVGRTVGFYRRPRGDSGT